MYDGKDEKRPFIGRIGDEEIAYRREIAQAGWSGRVAGGLGEERNEGPDGFVNLFRTRSAASRLSSAMYSHMSSRSMYASGWRMYPLMRGCYAGLRFFPAVGQMLLRRRWAYPAALDVVIAAVDHLAVSAQARRDNRAWHPARTRLSRVRFRLPAGQAAPEFRG